nr:Zinc knuckle family protein [Ipomoea batatas]
MYTLKLYYGGEVVLKPRVQYKNDRIEYFDNFSAEEDWEFEVGDNVNAFVDAIMNASIDVTVDANENKEKVIDNDKEKDFVHFEDELRSLCSSDSNLDLSKSSNVFHEKDLEKEGFQFIVGMIFNSNDEFKWAVKCNQALRKREIKFTKIEPARITVVCKDVNCEWRMYDSKSNSNSLLSIKSYNPDHTCAVQNDIKNVNAGFLAKYYQDEFKSADDSWNRTQFQQQVKKKFNCVISKHQSWRAKRLAHKENNGDDHKQFELLWDYCEELRKSNPGTTAKMKVDGDFTISGRSRFKR